MKKLSELTKFLLTAVLISAVVFYGTINGALDADANPQGNLVNASTLTITSGGAWQALFPLNNNRSTLWVQNPCTATSQGIVTAESLFVAFSATVPVAAPTAGGYFELQACGSLVMNSAYVSRQPVWVYAATTSHAFGAMDTQ